LAARRAKLAQHKERSANLAANTAYQQLEKDITADEASLDKLVAERRAVVAADLERLAREKRQAQIERLQADYVRLSASVNFLSDRLNTTERDQKQAVGDTLELEFSWSDYHRPSTFLDAISNPILSMQVERRAPERVRLFRAATVPARPDEEIPYKKLL